MNSIGTEEFLEMITKVMHEAIIYMNFLSLAEGKPDEVQKRIKEALKSFRKETNNTALIWHITYFKSNPDTYKNVFFERVVQLAGNSEIGASTSSQRSERDYLASLRELPKIIESIDDIKALEADTKALDSEEEKMKRDRARLREGEESSQETSTSGSFEMVSLSEASQSRGTVIIPEPTSGGSQESVSASEHNTVIGKQLSALGIFNKAKERQTSAILESSSSETDAPKPDTSKLGYSKECGEQCPII